MRLTIYILSLTFLLGFLCSCDVLEQEPQQSITPGLAFSNEAGARAAITGMYSRMQNADYYGSDLQYSSDSYTDISIYNGFIVAYQETDSRQIPTNNALIEDVWLQIYEVINVANEIIINVPNTNDENFNQEERNEVLGQALAVRGLSYLNLLTHFGEHDNMASEFGVPIVTATTGGDFAAVTNIPRNSVQQTYDQILADLLEAERLLPDTDDRFRATQAFAQGMLAKTYLFMGDYTNALAKASDVINNGNYELNPIYEDIFFSEATVESIFELAYNSQDQSSLSVFTIQRDEVFPDPEFVASFDSNDVRRNLIAPVEGFNNERFIKAEDIVTDANPAYIMRFAEIILISAEAKFFLGDTDGALADLNVVHTRAGLTPIPDASNFINDLAEEYKFEFFAEGLRFTSLVRLGLFEEVMGVEEFRRIYPIPARELRIAGNLLVQNPGY